MLTFVMRRRGEQIWHYPDGGSNVALCGVRLDGHLAHEDWRPLLAGTPPPKMCTRCLELHVRAEEAGHA